MFVGLIANVCLCVWVSISSRVKSHVCWDFLTEAWLSVTAHSQGSHTHLDSFWLPSSPSFLPLPSLAKLAGWVIVYKPFTLLSYHPALTLLFHLITAPACGDMTPGLALRFLLELSPGPTASVRLIIWLQLAAAFSSPILTPYFHPMLHAECSLMPMHASQQGTDCVPQPPNKPVTIHILTCQLAYLMEHNQKHNRNKWKSCI